MGSMKLDEGTAVAITKKCYRAHFSGEPEIWFDYLGADSVYVGTGEPLILGGDAIRNRFQAYDGQAVDILKEEYFPVFTHEKAAVVCGQVVIQHRAKYYRAVTRFTLGLYVVGERVQISHIHNSYEYQHVQTNKAFHLDLDGLNFVKKLMTDRPSGRRMAFKSGSKTIFLNPKNILYVQSLRKKTELVCLDCVIGCNSTIGELREMLPSYFYGIHRGYLVNTMFITGIRRFEVELADGTTLPIPQATYSQVKEALIARISDARETLL